MGVSLGGIVRLCSNTNNDMGDLSCSLVCQVSLEAHDSAEVQPSCEVPLSPGHIVSILLASSATVRTLNQES